MTKYDDLSDEQLIQEYRQGDAAVMDYLLNKYKTLVRSKANSLFILGGDTDDLIQEGMIGLFKAIRDYNDGESSFRYFADLCISRQMYSAIETAARKKNLPLAGYISLTEDGAENFIHEQAPDPEAVFIERENLQIFLDRLHEKLSPMEKTVMDYALKGLDYHQIAEAMGKSDKSIDNALQRIRGKVSKI